MKRNLAIFLQIAVILFGLGVLGLMLWEPQIEGVNANATFSEIYFDDPFLAYAYLGLIPFFVAIFKAHKVLGNAGHNNSFSPENVKALRTIKYCALTVVALIIGAEVYIIFVQSGSDDIAGGVAVGLMLIFLSTLVAIAARMIERFLQNSMDKKSGNDLTV